MNYLNSIYSILEKQTRMFADYMDSTPDNIKDFGEKYIKSREKSDYPKWGDIQSWEDARKFVYDEDEIKRVLIDCDLVDIDLNDYLYNDSFFYDIREYIFQFLKSKKIEINDAIKKCNDIVTLSEYLEEEYDYDLEAGFDDIIDIIILEDYSLIIETTYYDEMTSWVHSDHLIYREMTMSDKIESIDDIKESGVGIFWTFDKDSAEAYSGRGDGENNIVLLTATVEAENVDWEQTLTKSLYSLSNEREIELIEGTNVELLEMEIVNNSEHIRKIFDDDKKYFQSRNLPLSAIKKKGEEIFDFRDSDGNGLSVLV